MFTFFSPDLQLDCVFELTLPRLQSLGVSALLLDLDCTLKDYHAQEISTDVVAWLNSLREGRIRLCLFSNGKAPRIGHFAKQLNVPFVAKALKPLPFGCYRGMRQMGVASRRTAVVGDQLFADVLAGRLAGLVTILVRPTSPEEPWFTRIKRPFERQVLRWLKVRTEKSAQRKALV